MADLHARDGASDSIRFSRLRTWHKSVAAKLLIAFGIIVCLTIAATALSLLRFQALDDVITRLVGFSMPAVKTSLEIQAKATEVTAAAAQLGDAQNPTELFERNQHALDEIQELWARVANLGSTLGGGSTRRVQELVADIDAKVGEINREVTSNLGVISRRERLIALLADAVDKIDPLLRSASSGPVASADVSGAVYNARVQISAIVAALSQAASAAKQDRLMTISEDYQSARAILKSSLNTLVAGDNADTAAKQALLQSAEALLALGDGSNGVLALRQREQGLTQKIGTIQSALNSVSSDLRQEIAQLVAMAERESADSIVRSSDAINASRLWLILIAVASLIVAGLIVWLFVMRYVVARLTALSEGMLAIAQGHLATDIPSAGADEFGDMSRALVVFRKNAVEIHAAREEAERAREDAEAASRTKSAFLANMSHELRTPLNAIIGYSEILEEDSRDRGDDSSVADLNKIQSAGRHLLGLINDILDLSKIEAGRMDVYLEQVFISNLLDEVKAIVEPMMAKQGNHLVVECGSNVGSLRIDLTKLKQCLLNLLSNAAKFTNKGDVKLVVAREFNARGSRVSFAVSDSGIGMNEQQVARLFQAFTQADASTTRNFGGTGLGLSITKHFVTMLEGTISVTSQPGVGSTFTITLPGHGTPTSQIPKELRAEDHHDIGAITVLVVDDDPVVHDVLSSTLSKEGYNVHHARDGAEALDMMQQSPPDIVTLDVMMPKVDGWSSTLR